jgi:tRNA-dihydrouridine synthase B
MSNFSIKKHLKKNPFCLAPMDDVTDIGFRELCEEEGASFSVTELTSVEALIRNKVLKTRYEKGKLKINSVQLFGSKVQSFIDSISIVEKEADIIDINFGCPSASVTSNMSGSALLKDPKNVGKIVYSLVNNSQKPISAKIRLGYDKFSYLDVAKEIEDSGADFITVHGRTAKQKYSGRANWDAIKEIKEKINIPLIGNGDISYPKQIDLYLGSHADGFMIGRSAIGNPGIFKDFNSYYKNAEKKNEIMDTNFLKKRQKEYFKRYLLKLENRDFYNLSLKIQRQAMWFFKGIEGVSKLRTQLCKTKDIEEIKRIVDDF